MSKLERDFYLQDDVVFLAKDLLGRILFSNIGGKITGGIITETEAYKGPSDRASHAFNMRKTKRTQVMFEEGGIAYVYLCYGMHFMLNIVTNHKEIPHAILIRSIEPTKGLSLMAKRRNKKKEDLALTRGPGSTAQALGIDHSFNGLSLQSNKIWIEEEKICLKGKKISTHKRIGVEYAKEDALLPWRFVLSTKEELS